MDGWNLSENSELMLKSLNSWLGLLEKYKHYRLLPTKLCRFVHSDNDNSTEKTSFLGLGFVFDFVFVFLLSAFCYLIFIVLMSLLCLCYSCLVLFLGYDIFRYFFLHALT